MRIKTRLGAGLRRMKVGVRRRGGKKEKVVKK